MTESGDKPARSAPATPSGPWLFFVLVFCWTWLFWILAAVLGTSVQTPSGNALLLLGLLGPMLGGIGFAWFTLSEEDWIDYWWRIVDLKRIRPAWYLVIFLFVPGLMAAAVLLDVVSGGNATLTLIGARAAPFFAAPSTILPLLIGVFIKGPFPEELGWRGYALDRLQARWSPLRSSLILGAVWAAWHLPLFFIKGTYHYDQGVGSAWFWLFLLAVVPTSVVFTWIFNNTGRSILAAIAFHFSANLTYVVANATARTNLYMTLLWIAAAVVVAWLGVGGVNPRQSIARAPRAR